MNKRKCPVCGMELEWDIQRGSCDEYIIHCSNCGEYALSYEFCADYIDWPQPRVDLLRLAAYLAVNKGKGLPLCICERADTKSAKYDCVALDTLCKSR